MKVLAPLILLVAIAGVIASVYLREQSPLSASNPESHVETIIASSSADSLGSSTVTMRASSTPTKASSTTKPIKAPTDTPKNTDTAPLATTSEATKAPLPYSTPPESFDTIAVATRAALVNILCMPQGGTLKPISGSGVLVDPQGVILTNAHVAQYVLLSEDKRINLSCMIKTGSPATAHWRAAVMYIPEVWVNAHYKEINQDRVSGTGEHDYALLKILSDMQGNPVKDPLPYLPIETRENVAFEADPVLVAGYPAELVGGIVAQQGLYAALSPSTIKKLMTFETGSIDVLSVGGVLEAQGGSSGGPVVNTWRHVVSIIVTTSEGATTADRELHTLGLNYIARDFGTLTGRTIESFVSGDVNNDLDVFTRNIAPALVQKYIDFLKR